MPLQAAADAALLGRSALEAAQSFVSSAWKRGLIRRAGASPALSDNRYESRCRFRGGFVPYHKLSSPVGFLSSLDASTAAGNTGPRMVESFSVQLGSQHKTPYNMRLMTSSVAAMLAPVAAGTDPAQEAAYRAQTALSLYSRSIAGLVVLSSPDVVASAGARGLHPGAV